MALNGDTCDQTMNGRPCQKQEGHEGCHWATWGGGWPGGIAWPRIKYVGGSAD